MPTRIRTLLALLMLLMSSFGCNPKLAMPPDGSSESSQGDFAVSTSSRVYRDPSNGTERLIPKIGSDDDGYEGPIIVSRADTSAIKSCGIEQATIPARVADCNYRWDGSALGKMGEGTWSLVTKANDKEVWRDDRSGNLWSDDLGEKNWCQASGNVENAGEIDCSPGGGLQPASPISVCAEEAGLNSEGFDSEKGGMRKSASPASPPVTWRLPTRKDYLEAYSNGISYVLPRFLEKSNWTASIYGADPVIAWYFYLYSDGYLRLHYDVRDSANSVRCIGR